MPLKATGVRPGSSAFGLELLGLRTKRLTDSAYSCPKSESGTAYFVVGSSGCAFTLPGPFIDGFYLFVCAVDQTMSVATPTADTMITLNDVAADSVATPSSYKAGSIMIAISDGQAWVVNAIQTTSTTLTVTTA